MKVAVLLLAVASVASLFSPLLRPSNSKVLAEQGLEMWDEGAYTKAVESFEAARAIRTTAASTFDLGTSLVAAEEHGTGESVLRSLHGDETLAAKSLYNSGNSQLMRRALDEAIASYSDALRLEPSNISAKRNLEIALQRRARQQEENQAGASEEDPEGDQPAPAESDGSDEALDPDAEQILRSVDQQEREELSRMRRANAARRPTDW